LNREYIDIIITDYSNNNYIKNLQELKTEKRIEVS